MTGVFPVRIVEPLVAATALKWQGGPHLASANGVGSFRRYWNLLDASLRTYFDATVSHDRVHLLTIALLHRLGSTLSNSLPLVTGICSITPVDVMALVPWLLDSFFNFGYRRRFAVIAPAFGTPNNLLGDQPRCQQ